MSYIVPYIGGSASLSGVFYRILQAPSRFAVKVIFKIEIAGKRGI